MAAMWKTAVISGGGSGLGLRMAEECLSAGGKVALLDLAYGEAALARLTKAAGGNLEGRVWRYQVDMRQGEAVTRAAAEAFAALGRIDLALNSAGVQHVGEFENISEEQFRRVMEINVMGSRNFAAGVLPYLQEGAQLALIASLAGIVGTYGYSPYNASKFAVVGLAGALRLECAPKGICVSCVCPPEVETPMVEEERRMSPKATAKLKEFAGTLQVEPAVREILEQLLERRYMVIPGARARLTYRLAGWFPGLLRRVSDGIVRKALAS
ncbi:SDR family NAD(P)-dependent oxidoreductase [Pseudomonas sp. N040]|uniref:SDR family NAD(P)-dependent oxidoreductase n=1 Tax=Pseudomonas sp. N040 TaxID=2785325 RepID=UPI0018A32F24|nr:SDR family NAD(P)-dependent oxidoreductase [Pseudomonas sp. N040]MBF7729092.1 SDR family NAD(P)-dependent oxidoreductase [Pseudomonas sp. N040]MBW7012732.1 SDR family NAD(P)-dependent oxidoreductase [Pseudomonas sp. N040]